MEEELDLRELIRVILRRKRLIIAILILAVATAYVISARMTPIYEASSTILIQDSRSSVERLFLDGLAGSSGNQVSNYVQILQSRTLAQRTAEHLGNDYDVHSSEFASFRDSISVQPIGNTELIRISVQNADPQRAADVSNAMAASFIQFSREMNREEARSARSFIGEQLGLVEEELRRAELALQSYREREQVFAPTEQTRIALERLTELESRYMETRVAQEQTARRLDEIRRRIQNADPTFISSRTISNNPLVVQHRAQLSALETELAGIRGQYGDAHPRVAALRAQIAEIRSQLSTGVERIVGTETRTANPIYQALLRDVISLETEAVLYASRLEALQARIADVERRLRSLPEKELTLARLMRDRSVSEQIYMLLRNKYEEMRITEAMRTADVTVIDSGIVPQHPIRPRTHLNVAVAAVLGLFVGFGSAFILAFLDTSIKSAEEAESLLGVPVMGRILSTGPGGK